MQPDVYQKRQNYGKKGNFNPEMLKAADPADISMLFFPSWCYFFGYTREKNVPAPVLLAPVSTHSFSTISISNSVMGTF